MTDHLDHIRHNLSDIESELKSLQSERSKEHALFEILGPFASDFVKRLADFRVEKQALWQLVKKHLARMVSKQKPSIFFESGSTVGWATLHLRDDPLREQFHIITNNLLVRMSLHKKSSEPELLPYPWDSKYWGTFPFPETIEEVRAQPGDMQSRYNEVCGRLGGLDCLFLTASRLSLMEGPFGGSIQNAMFKHAAYTSAPDIKVLLDGSKLLFGQDALDEERRRPNCIQIFAPSDTWAQPADRSPLAEPLRRMPRILGTTWNDLVSRNQIELWIAVPHIEQVDVGAFLANEAPTARQERRFAFLRSINVSPGNYNVQVAYKAALADALRGTQLRIIDHEQVSVGRAAIMVYRVGP
jgi:hypothetical protein